MSPFQKAAEYYDKSDRFRQDLTWFMNYGYIYSSPTAFVMARPCDKDDIDAATENFKDEPAKKDCLYVWLAAGKDIAKELGRHIPDEFEWVAWRREKKRGEKTVLIKSERLRNG